MEDGMPRIRIATAGAFILLSLAVTLGSAAAQSVTTGSVGKPLPLLQFTRHKSKTRLPLHHRVAVVTKKKRVFRQRIAKHVVAKPRRAIVDARPTPAPAQIVSSAIPAKSTIPANIWPTDGAVTPDSMPALTPDQPAPSVTTEPTVDTDPDQIVTGSHSVRAALPNGLNQAAPSADPVQTTTVAATAPAPVVHAMVVTAEPRSLTAQSPISSASWLAHVLAALGGAVAAGVVAWFLIKPAPERTYG
jgi:hypothetical protein